MLSINMNDVIGFLEQCKPQLIGFGVVVVIAIIVMIACAKLQSKKTKFTVRSLSGLAIFLALVVVANLICTGPAASLLDLVSAYSEISAETATEAEELSEKIAGEGIVLLQNDDNFLPLSDTTNLNVFGWASTNPVYGGTGSGALNDSYHTVTLLEGLTNAGFAPNTALSDFYTAYETVRPSVEYDAQDWTLPEPAESAYGSTLISGAQSYSDVAVIVIGRVGGENSDLPNDMMGVINGTYHMGPTASYDDTKNAGNDWDEGDHYLQLSNREEELVDLVCDNFDKVILLYNGANTIELGFVNDHPEIKSLSANKDMW